MCRVSYGFESFGSAYPDAFNGAVPVEIIVAVLSSIAQKIKTAMTEVDEKKTLWIIP